jgi:hypothetical protein
MTLQKQTHLKEVLKLYKKLNSSEKVAKQLADKYGLEYNGTLSRKIRHWLNGEKEEVKEEQSEIFNKAKSKKVEKGCKVYIITAAQNATKINKQFFENILAYTNHLEGCLEVIPFRYRNPTRPNEKKDDDWWDENLIPYLIANRHSVHKNLQVLADIKIQPTACLPLTGTEGLTGVESSIMAHPRQHMKVLPTLDSYPKKVMFTTGVVTDKNYSESKIGKLSEFHHTFGFVIVEIKSNDKFFIRHVSAKSDGSFYDLDNYISNGEVVKDETSVEVLVAGDLHLGQHCDTSLKTTYEMLGRFKPKHVILHDLIDGKACNHHEANDPFKQLEKDMDGTWDLEKEIKMSLDFLETLLPYNPKIISANHNNFLDKWLISADFKKDRNKYQYLKYAKLKADNELPRGIFAYEVEKKFGNKVKCFSDNDSFKVRNVELGLHGHLGVSGSRGGILQFKRLNTKMVSAHTHSPAKIDNVVVVGTLTKLRIGYNNGLSNWLNSNVIIHRNGKTQNLLIIDGEYTNN